MPTIIADMPSSILLTATHAVSEMPNIMSQIASSMIPIMVILYATLSTPFYSLGLVSVFTFAKMNIDKGDSMKLEQLVAEHDLLDEKVNTSSDNLHKLCKEHMSMMGLVSDEFRATVAYKEAQSDFTKAFNALRAFNSQANKNKELRQFLDARLRERRFNKV